MEPKTTDFPLPKSEMLENLRIWGIRTVILIYLAALALGAVSNLIETGGERWLALTHQIVQWNTVFVALLLWATKFVAPHTYWVSSTTTTSYFYQGEDGNISPAKHGFYWIEQTQHLLAISSVMSISFKTGQAAVCLHQSTSHEDAARALAAWCDKVTRDEPSALETFLRLHKENPLFQARLLRSPPKAR